MIIFFDCLAQRQCSATGILLEGLPRSRRTAAGPLVRLQRRCVDVCVVTRQRHHRDSGEPIWCGLPSAQSLLGSLLRGLRESQALSWWGSSHYASQLCCCVVMLSLNQDPRRILLLGLMYFTALFLKPWILSVLYSSTAINHHPPCDSPPWTLLNKSTNLLFFSRGEFLNRSVIAVYVFLFMVPF